MNLISIYFNDGYYDDLTAEEFVFDVDDFLLVGDLLCLLLEEFVEAALAIFEERLSKLAHLKVLYFQLKAS